MLAGIVLVVVLGILTINFLGINGSSATPTPSPDDTKASNAVIAGVEAFYNINYQEGKETWLNRFCAVSSDSGCQFLKSGSTALWKRFEDQQTISQGKALPLEKVRTNADEQVWRVSITLTQPLPGSEKTNAEAYVLAVRVKDAWKFDRFLMDKEIQGLKQGMSQGQTK
jgi:hypothetical protein